MMCILSKTNLFFNSKVDYGGPRGNLWGVVGVGQLSGDIEAEVWIIFYLLFT